MCVRSYFVALNKRKLAQQLSREFSAISTQSVAKLSGHHSKLLQQAKRTLRFVEMTSNVDPVAMIQVGVGFDTEARIFHQRYPQIKIVGADPVPTRHGGLWDSLDYPGVVEEIAIMDYEGEIDFKDKKRTYKSHICTPGNGSRTVQTDTLDNLAARHNITESPVLLWMDAEGSELYALRGGEKTLGICKWIFIELWDMPSFPMWGNVTDVRSILKKHGFENVYNIGHDSYFLKLDDSIS